MSVVCFSACLSLHLLRVFVHFAYYEACCFESKYWHATPHPMCLPSQVDKLRRWKKFVSLAIQLDSATHGYLDHNPK